MKKSLSIIQILLIGMLVLSCSSEAFFKIGTDWVDTSLKLVYIDSCSAKLSTVRIDSVPTHNRNTILLGKYEDINIVTGEKLTGTIKATSYLEISNPSVPSNLGVNPTFDSLVMEMRFNGFYMGDTANNDMHLFVHQLEERMKLDVAVGTEVYYNTMSFRYNPEPLAEAAFPIRPSDSTSNRTIVGGIPVEPVRIKLPDSLGQEMFDKIENKDDEFSSNENFLDYFKGLALVAGDDVGAIAGFKTDTSFKINLYYHTLEEFKTDKVITFSINQINQFNNIISDRSETSLLPDSFTDNEISSSLTGNQSFISAGDGLYTKIEFPNLHDILLTGTYGIVEQAILEIRPVYGTYRESSSPVPLPSALTISTSSVSGEAESALANSQGQSQYGNLIIDPQFVDNTLYSFDVTAFVQNQMSAPKDNKLYLTLRMGGSEMQNSTRRLVIGDSNHSISAGNITYYNRIKLKLYYNMYNEKN
jgi:hypothetical protein